MIRIKNFFRSIKDILIMILVSAVFGISLLLLAYAYYPGDIFLEYISSADVLFFNVFPVVCLTILLYAVFGRVWLAFLIGGGAPLGLSLANYFKVYFRDDALFAADLMLFKEAGNMVTSGEYQLFVSRNILVVVMIWIVSTLVLYFRVPKNAKKKYLWRGGTAVAAVLSLLLIWPVYRDGTVYEKVSVTWEGHNIYNQTEQYISHGFLYPFVHSSKNLILIPPEGYQKSTVQEKLAKYEETGIPEEKQVNVIAVMWEAFGDFSTMGIEGLDDSAYSFYHQLEEEGYSGRLVTDIFAAGTVHSERNFLTGVSGNQEILQKKTNSYVWYLRDQGYTVEGSHPHFEWFYNRQNINKRLGFEQYRFREGDYERYLENTYWVQDQDLFPEIYEDFVANKETGKPYFSFSVTVAGHGPYSTVDYSGEKTYLTGNYSDECKNAMNNYLNTIDLCDKAIGAMVDKLRADEEPVVLLLFGDHMPWMGEGNIFYEELGISLDRSTDEGFLKYYSTPYCIWANDAAKAVLGHDVQGEGPMVSPCFLMNVLFEQFGWDGPAFMQAMDETMQQMPVISTAGMYMIDGELVNQVPEDKKAALNDWQNMQFYWKKEFLY